MLSYFRMEYRLMVTPLAFIIMELCMIFDTLPAKNYHMKLKGANEYFWICLIPRIFRYTHFSLACYFGNEWFEKFWTPVAFV
jgi:hypothetical protein